PPLPGHLQAPAQIRYLSSCSPTPIPLNRFAYIQRAMKVLSRRLPPLAQAQPASEGKERPAASWQQHHGFRRHYNCVAGLELNVLLAAIAEHNIIIACLHLHTPIASVVETEHDQLITRSGSGKTAG